MRKRVKAFGSFTLLDAVKNSKAKVRCSMALMGLGQMLYGQWVKGLLYFLLEAGAIVFFVLFGFEAIGGFFTLGTQIGNAWEGIPGDDSVIMMLLGIFAFIVLAFFIVCYFSNVKDAYRTQLRVEAGKKPTPFKQEITSLIDDKFHITALLLPVIGVCVFNILPIIFMIFIAFTNYGGEIKPPQHLVDWVGFQTFIRIFSLSDVGSTFFKILLWNLIWAFSATALNYFGGLGLALLLNKKCVKGKIFWRAFPILAYAIPGFITLLAFKFMFSAGGPINQLIVDGGSNAVDFLGIYAGLKVKLIGLGVNAWISIPTSMLLATGILSNMNTDLYEAARIDGANAWRQFVSLTLPFVLFATMPVLISQFVGNFNNFGIFFFLRDKFISDGYYHATDTDLLINWLYQLTLEKDFYNIGAALSLIIFIITSAISLSVYVLSPSYKQEETFR